VRNRIGRVRRCTSLHPLWGKKLAVLVGDFLEALLQSDAGKFACLRLGFQLQLPQGRHARLF
jgi:hypothetical protein